MTRLRTDAVLQQIENQLVAAGDAQANPTGTLRIKVVRAEGTEAFEPFNIEHKVRLSDNPWLAKSIRNLIFTDAPQNQQYLEALPPAGVRLAHRCRRGLRRPARSQRRGHQFRTRHSVTLVVYDLGPTSPRTGSHRREYPKGNLQE